jgi:NAD(P)-dependent dehydrogenase (short-subunit alcohol dehydrogenase family)
MPDDPTSLFRLDGKVALVTGGSRGLGREMVLAFAQAGADVIIASRKQDACDQLAKEVEAGTGRKALAHAAHVGSWEALDQLVEASYDRFGKVDVLVNNAGMSPVYDELINLSEALYDKVFDVNLKGPFRLCTTVGKRMADGGGGSILNISSIGAVRPRADIAPYAASKAGLNAITVAFAHAYGPTVRCNGIMAGPFLTEVSKYWDMEVFTKRWASAAQPRGGRPDEIVGAALYFASEASSFTTGAVLRVDGGRP